MGLTLAFEEAERALAGAPSRHEGALGLVVTVWQVECGTVTLVRAGDRVVGAFAKTRGQLGKLSASSYREPAPKGSE